MQLSKFGDYSFRVLIFAGTKNALCTTSEVSKAFDISQDHLVKVVHHLEKIGLLKTKKGKNGGFQLSKNPSEILIGEAFREIEQNLDLVECFSTKNNECKISGPCRLKHIFYDALDSFIDTLDQHTLQDLLSPNRPLKKILLNDGASV